MLRRHINKTRLCLSFLKWKPCVGGLPSYLQAADVFVLPSRREGLSNALLEAMAAGLTVVVSDLPGNRAVVRDGENGLMFPVDDLAALQNHLTIAGSPDLRANLGRQARATMSDYSMQSTAARHRAVYETRPSVRHPGKSK